jgi:hypothetical protein
MEHLQSLVDSLQTQLEAQETELATLRRQTARTGANPVQDIYERANAELKAVKSELSRRTGVVHTPPGGIPVRTPTIPQVKPPRTAVPALDMPDPSPPKKADERE